MRMKIGLNTNIKIVPLAPPKRGEGVAQRRAFAAPKRLRPRRREMGIFSVHLCFDRV